MRIIIFVVGTLLMSVSALAQGRVAVDPQQRFLLLSTNKTSTMQKELDEVSAQGFRVMVGASSSGNTEMVLFLERVARPPETFKYKLLATTRTGTMQKELNAIAQEGYRLIERTVFAKEGFLSNEIIVILEKSPTSKVRYEYLLLATSQTTTLQKEVSQAVAEGYVLVGLVGRGENMVIMERESDPK